MQPPIGYLNLAVHLLENGAVKYLDSEGNEWFQQQMAAEEKKGIIHSLPAGEVTEYCLICLFLVLLGGLTSGLNVSLMSISKMKIDIMSESSNPYDKEVVEKIGPIIENEHLLLVTLLVANAAAMEALPIFLDELVASWLAIIISVTFVLIFGEIIPQAVFAKDPIRVGYKLSWLVQGLQFILYPICKPIAWILDRTLEHNSHTTGAVFTKEEMAILFKLIKENPDYLGTKIEFDNDELLFLNAALTLKNRPITDEMVQLEEVTTLPHDLALDLDGLTRIWKSGFSRIPVYKGRKENVIGLLLTKDLIKVDPSPTLTVEQFVRKKLVILAPNTNMIAAINVFQNMRSHFALITEDYVTVRHCLKNETDIPSSVVFVGCITLEDILEELIAEEVEDEFDEMGFVEASAAITGDDKNMSGASINSNKAPSAVISSQSAAAPEDQTVYVSLPSESDIRGGLLSDGSALSPTVPAVSIPRRMSSKLALKGHVPEYVGKRMQAKHDRNNRIRRNFMLDPTRARLMDDDSKVDPKQITKPPLVSDTSKRSRLGAAKSYAYYDAHDDGIGRVPATNDSFFVQGSKFTQSAGFLGLDRTGTGFDDRVLHSDGELLPASGDPIPHYGSSTKSGKPLLEPLLTEET